MADWIDEGANLARRAVKTIAGTLDTNDWWIQESGGETRQISDAKLRKRLRHGDYSGLELVRREAETEWKPLHTLPVFREEVPHEGDSLHVASRRALRGWFLHAASCLFVVPMIGLMGFQWWMLFAFGGWGIGFAVHTLKMLPALMAFRGVLDSPLLRAAGARIDDALPRVPVAGAPPGAPAPPARDEFTILLDAAIADLEKALASSTVEKKPDVAAIRKAVEELHRRRVALGSLGGAALIGKLETERDESKTRLAGTSDARTAAVLQDELNSIEARVAATREAANAETRLAARERSLLHQIEALRASLLRASSEDEGVGAARDSLHEALARIDADLAAESEIENHVARTAAQRQRT